MKKILLPVLILALVIQLFVPSYMIWQRYDVLKSGTEVKFDIGLFDPYDAFRGRYVSIRVEDAIATSFVRGRYGILEIDENGFAKISRVESEPPKEGLYLISSEENYFSFPHNRYYMEETLAPEAEKVIGASAEAYITVRIKNGKSVISGMYIGDVPIEEYLTE
ncbi:MAG: GDYXXLXY domain-containing protein [Oscillospiraceae bacterium]|nr:GDYXXLXY domain-containing protein [Oscillospiraceae bacterium]